MKQTVEIPKEEVQKYIDLWLQFEKVKNQFETMKEEFVLKFKSGMVSSKTEQGYYLHFNSFPSKSTSYASIFKSAKEYLQKMKSKEAQKLLKKLDKWYLMFTTSTDKDVITPKQEKDVIVKKYSKVKKEAI